MEISKVTGVGVGLRPKHYPYLENNPETTVEWFEAISENYMSSEGRPMQMLEKIRERFPVALHGVSLSIGSTLSGNHLAALKNLAERIQPFIISDHFCWGNTGGTYLHDLLPLPHNEESLSIVVDNLDRVQNFLGRTFTLENVSSYLTFRSSTMTEWDFITETARRSGCTILLDVNNVYVSSVNHGFDPYHFIDNIPVASVAQIHLAGYTDMGDFLFDTHSRPVTDPVWKLYEHTIAKMPEVPVLIEWDEDIPDFSRLEEEAARAREIKESWLEKT